MRILFSTLLLSFSVAVLAAGPPLPPVADPHPAPKLQLNDTTGKPYTLTEYRGKVIVVNFWATWCPPCVKELPALSRLQRAMAGKGIQVLGVNMGETRKAVATFTQRVSVSFPILLDTQMAIGPKWGVEGLPTTFVIDPHRRIVYETLGAQPWDSPAVIAQLQALHPSP